MDTIHADRLERARLALEGLSIGDSFGERFFGHTSEKLDWMIQSRVHPEGVWLWSDDTAMALGIFETLRDHRGIVQDSLAKKFADRYGVEPGRGYGGGAHRLLQSLQAGDHWESAASGLFDGVGSMGNGAAMRSAPIGAYFSEDLSIVAKHAQLSAEVTHAHPDGIAGSIAIAIASAVATQMNLKKEPLSGQKLLAEAFEHTPTGDTKDGIRNAIELDPAYAVSTAIQVLGNGSRVLSSDTVPFALWCAARHMKDFHEAMWSTVSGGGDRDTTCAMVGGILACALGDSGIPASMRAAREPLPI